MNTRHTLLGAVLLLVGVAACDKHDPPSASSSGATAAASTSAALTASAAPSAAPATTTATAEGDPLPSHADVAKTVRSEVTKQNYKTELEKLEKSADEP